MKIKLLLLFVIIFSLAGTCESEELTPDCNCEKVYYAYKVRLDEVQATWYYEKTYSEPADCKNNTGKYVQIDSNKYFRIECN